MKRAKLVTVVALLISYISVAQNLQWSRSMGSTSDDAGYSITVDEFGNSYITGTFQGTIDFDPGVGAFNLTSTGGNDIFI